MGLAIRFMDTDAFAVFWDEQGAILRPLIDDAKKE